MMIRPSQTVPSAWEKHLPTPLAGVERCSQFGFGTAAFLGRWDGSGSRTGQRFQFAEQLHVDVELGQTPLVAGLRLGADQRLRRTDSDRDVCQVALVVVDLPVQVLTQILAARKAVDLLVRVLQERNQFAAVGTPAVDVGLASPIGGRLGLGRGAGPQFPQAMVPQPVPGRLGTRVGGNVRRQRLHGGDQHRVQAVAFGIGQDPRTKRSRRAVSPMAANARNTRSTMPVR